MKIIIKKELVFVIGILFLVCGGALEMVFTNRVVENDSLNMLFLFCSTSCNMISIFIFAFILARSVCNMVHINIKVALGAAIVATCFFSASRLVQRNDKPVIPIVALVQEGCDILYGTVNIEGDNAKIGAVPLFFGFDNDSTERYYLEYEYRNANYRIRVSERLLSVAERIDSDDGHTLLVVYPNTGIITDIVTGVKEEDHLNVENEKTEMDTDIDTITITPMDLGTRYDEAVVPAVTVKRDNNDMDLDIRLSNDPNFNETSVGYLGKAYYIISSRYQEARLTFIYDKSLLANSIGDEFKPAIYCLYDHMDYYPLPDQVWEDNTVSATITDFDTDHIYMLIDENVYLQWQEEYTDFWRQYEEEHPGELERMMRNQQELDEEREKQ